MTRSLTLLSLTALAAGFGLAALTAQPALMSDAGKSGTLQLARHGADDKPGDDRGGKRGGHGADDPAGHASLEGISLYQLARHGADDKPGDDRGRRGGRGGGHGADDGPNHA